MVSPYLNRPLRSEREARLDRALKRLRSALQAGLDASDVELVVQIHPTLAEAISASARPDPEEWR